VAERERTSPSSVAAVVVSLMSTMSASTSMSRAKIAPLAGSSHAGALSRSFTTGAFLSTSMIDLRVGDLLPSASVAIGR
jgi:hypothetical protein